MKFIIFCFILIIAFFSLIYIIPLPNRIDENYSIIIRYDDNSIMRIYKTADDSFRIFTELEDIDPKLIAAVLCYEDKYFYYHPGVNPFSLVRALYQNIKARKIISGGSTLSMQLARIVEPKPRTIKSKLIEIFRAIQFELRLGKKKILQSYLNLAPYGGNYYGLSAASLMYFRKTPENLSPAEIAYLISLPQSPSLRKASEKRFNEIKKARNQALKRMKECKIINDAEYIDGINSAVPTKIYDMPLSAPSAADFVKLYAFQRNVKNNSLRTTINRDIQRTAESIMRNYKSFIEQNGATQASAVIIRNDTREVVALVGSLDYWDKNNDGQVLGFWSFRSPGSTLKPFLYALALDKGLINTDMLIEDVPVQFNGFRPKNFNKNWQGLVRAEDALAESLNVPFINILKKVGIKNFLYLLDKAQLNYAKNISYGLSLITGSIEVRLLELTNLYTTLARNGLHGNFRILKGEELKEYKLFSSGATELTKKALSIRNRPDAPNLRDFMKFPKYVYWKTGTSWGRRDAWSIGWIDNYTVGLWVGNFSGKSSENIVGSALASPIMFDLLQALPKNKNIFIPYNLDRDLIKIAVCEFSGYRPSTACPKRKYIYVLKFAIPQKSCPYHKKFIVEKDKGYLACPYKHYRNEELEEKSLLILPDIIANVMNKGTTLPILAPDCSSLNNNEDLRIIYPSDGETYITSLGIKLSTKIPLLAYSSSPENLINWFINGDYIATTHSGQTLFIDPIPGNFQITALDSQGNLSQVSITISN